MLRIIDTLIFLSIIYCERLTFQTDMVIKTKDGQFFLLDSHYEEKNKPTMLSVPDVTATNLESTVEITTSLTATIKMTGTESYDEDVTTEAKEENKRKISEFVKYEFATENVTKTNSSTDIPSYSANQDFTHKPPMKTSNEKITNTEKATITMTNSDTNDKEVTTEIIEEFEEFEEKNNIYEADASLVFVEDEIKINSSTDIAPISANQDLDEKEREIYEFERKNITYEPPMKTSNEKINNTEKERDPTDYSEFNMEEKEYPEDSKEGWIVTDDYYYGKNEDSDEHQN